MRMESCGLVARLGNSGRAEESRDVRVLGLQGLFSLTRPLLVDHWPSEIKEPQDAAGRGGPQQNSPQRHGTIGSMHRQSVALRESKLGVVWSCLGASRSSVSSANLSFAGGPFAKSVVCCDCHRTLSIWSVSLRLYGTACEPLLGVSVSIALLIRLVCLRVGSICGHSHIRKGKQRDLLLSEPPRFLLLQ